MPIGWMKLSKRLWQARGGLSNPHCVRKAVRGGWSYWWVT